MDGRMDGWIHKFTFMDLADSSEMVCERPDSSSSQCFSSSLMSNNRSSVSDWPLTLLVFSTVLWNCWHTAVGGVASWTPRCTSVTETKLWTFVTITRSHHLPRQFSTHHGQSSPHSPTDSWVKLPQFVFGYTSTVLPRTQQEVAIVLIHHKILEHP